MDGGIGLAESSAPREALPAGPDGLDAGLLLQLADHLPLAIALYAGDPLRCRAANPVFRRALAAPGEDVAEAIGLVPPVAVAEAAATAARTGQAQACHAAELAPESFWDLDLLPQPADAPGMWPVLLVGRDVTHHLLARREAEEGRAALNAILAHIPSGLTIAAAPDATITRISAHGLSLAQRTEAELTGPGAVRDPSAWQIFHADGRTRAKPEELPITRVVTRGEVVRDETWLLRRPDGSLLPIMCDAGPIRDAASHVTGAIVAWRDISRLHAAEAALRESEAQFRQIAEALPDFVWVGEPETRRLIYVSPAYERMWGRSVAELQTDYRAWMAGVLPEDRPGVVATLNSISTSREPYVLEYRIRRPDGAIRWIHTRGYPLAQQPGDTRPLRVIGLTSDVTERRAEEEARRERETMLARVQEVAGVGGFEWDLRTGLTRRTPAYLALHGLPPQQAVSSRAEWAENVHPDDRARVDAAIARTVEGRCGSDRYEVEFRFIRPSTRETLWISAQGEVERDATGQPIRIVGAHHDVTARRTAEQALRAGETRMRLALEAAGAGTWAIDIETGTIRRDAATRAMLGSVTEVPEIEDLNAARARVHPDDRDMVERTLREALEPGSDGRLVREYRVLRLREYGAQRWVESRGRVFFEGEGAERRAVRVIGTITDITARKTAEDRQALLVAELNHRVKNTLATVQAIADQTRRAAEAEYGEALGGGARFQQKFLARLGALARAHDLLTTEGWRDASLDALLRAALAPHATPKSAGPGVTRIAIAGPPVRLSPEVAVAIGMAFHELATNAAKYGALSTEDGEVAIAWSLAEGTALSITWSERGGPMVQPPSRQGFGTRMLRRVVTGQLRGDLALDWAPEGMRCRIRLPLGSRLVRAEGAPAN